jgi:hypothetical protein
MFLPEAATPEKISMRLARVLRVRHALIFTMAI